MKNKSKSNFSGKNSTNNKKDSNYRTNSKNNNYSKNSNRFLNNTFNNKDVNNLTSSGKKINYFSSSKKRKPQYKSGLESSTKISDINQEISNKRNYDDWIWGKHSVFESLISERPINRIWCTSEIYSSEKFYILLKNLKTNGVLIEEVSWNRLSQLTSGASHQGVALQLACSMTISLEKLISFSKNNSRNSIIIALDGITDPHNVGAIIRSAEAFGCKGIIIPQRRSAGLTGTVAKVAAGALEHLPVCRVVNLNRALEELKKNGFIVIGLSGDGKLPISDFHEKNSLVIVVGAEDKGISLLTQKKCDYLLSIPLKGKTSSLNASVAAAVSLFYLSIK